MKRITALALCLLLVFSFASCTDQQDGTVDAATDENPGHYETPTPVFPMEDDGAQTAPTVPDGGESPLPNGGANDPIPGFQTPDGPDAGMIPGQTTGGTTFPPVTP